GIELQPVLKAEDVDFGEVVVDGKSETGYITVRNIGRAAATVQSARFDSRQMGFGIRFRPSSTPVEPGGQLRIPVAFLPRQPGSYHASVIIEHDGSASPLRVELTGSGKSKPVTLVGKLAVTRSIRFGDTPVGSLSNSEQIELRNVGNGDLQITSIDRSGDI